MILLQWCSSGSQMFLLSKVLAAYSNKQISLGRGEESFPVVFTQFHTVNLYIFVYTYNLHVYICK